MTENNLEINNGIDIDNQIQEKLKQLLNSDYEAISDEDKSVINSLEKNDKESFLSFLTKYPEFLVEFIDNLPIEDKEKVIKIIKLFLLKEKEESSKKSKQDILKSKQDLEKLGVAKLGETIQNNKELQLVIKTTKELKQQLNLEQNPNYKNYQEQAKKQLIASNPGIEKNGNFSDYIDSYILIQHQKEFLAGRPDLQASFDTLNQNASKLEVFKNIRIDEYIDRNFRESTLKREKDQLKTSLLPNGEGLEINGREFKTGDQVAILDKESGAKKFIEKYGYRINTTQELETPYKYLYQKDQLTSNHKVKTKEYESKTNTINSIADDIKKLDLQISQINPLDTEKSDFQKDIFEREKEQLEKDFTKLTEEKEKLEQKIQDIKKEATEIESHEKQRVSSYRGLQQVKDDNARQTLEFLHNIGFTNISQSDFETMILIVNQFPTKYGFTKQVSLEDIFTKDNSGDEFKHQKEFINFFNRLLGLKDKEQINVSQVANYVNGNDKSLTGSKFTTKVRNELYSEGSFRFSLLDERFNSSSKK